MHINFKSITLLIVLFAGINVFAQKTQSFTLQQAQDFAIKNNYERLNAERDVLIAKKKVWETTAIGLPQISAEGNFKNFIDLPTSLIPANIFDPNAPAGTFAELQFGTKYSTSVDFTVSQLLFDGSYIIGLQAAKTYKELSKNALKKSEIEVRSEIAKTYHLVLTAEKNKEILEELMHTSKQLTNQTTKIYKNGLIEEESVDQLNLTLKDLKSSISNANRQIEIAQNLLKFQMGINLKDTITLTDSVELFINNLVTGVTPQTKFDYNKHIDYITISTSEKLAKLNWQREKTTFLPSIGAFFSHQRLNQNNQFDAFSGGKYYLTTLWGLSVKIPIFSSGMRISKMEQAKIAYQKAQTTTLQVEQGLALKVKQAKANYIASFDIYNNSEDGLALAKKINNKTIKKYNEGMSSSLILSQTQTQYLNAEGKYVQALLNLLNAKVDLKKALGE